jgi:hypothetical protein
VTWHDSTEGTYNTTQSILRLFEKEETNIDGVVFGGSFCFMLNLLSGIEPTTFLNSSGDLAYADGYISDWEFFLDTISPIAGKTAPDDEFVPFTCCLCCRFPIIPVSSGQS